MLAVLIGTRPEAIKLRSIVHGLGQRNAEFRVIYTGQQLQLEQEFFHNLNIPIHITLNTRERFDSISKELSRLLVELNDVLMSLDFRGVIVQGDTTTALAGALAAALLKIPVHHIEAGLRTHNRSEPFPEEINRRIVSVLATENFAPTDVSKVNLLKDGVDAASIHVVGNTVVDSLRMSLPLVQFQNKESNEYTKQIRIFVSCHRRELTDPQRDALAKTVLNLGRINSNIEIDFTLHSNPLFSIIFRSQLENQKSIKLYEGLSYLETLRLISNSDLVITDSGGLQEECVTLGTPLFIYRSVTERPECLDAKCTKLMPPQDKEFSEEILAFLEQIRPFKRVRELQNIVGDGNSASKIIDVILDSRP